MAYIYIILLLFGSAFFSGTEIAYTSLNKLKLKKESERQDRHLQRLYKRRKIDENGNVTSNWSILIKNSALE